jgi:glycosyltransferase involved in cell wall biosynthesis
LESLLAGADQPEEILIYDDASQSPAEQYLPAGFRGRVIRGEVNRGPSHGRNALLATARSDYIHFHDADDLFHPAWCQRVRETLERTGADVAFTEIRSIRDDEPLSERVLDLGRLARDPDLVRFCIRGFMLVPAGTYRRTLVLEAGGYRGDLWQSEDFEFHVRLASTRPHYECIDDPRVTIRVRRESRSQNRYETWTCAVEAIRILADHLPPEYSPELAEKASSAGSALFQLGARQEAAEAFSLARRLGPPRFAQQRKLYRAIARVFGPLAAEHVGAFYRRALSSGLRSRLAARGG